MTNAPTIADQLAAALRTTPCRCESKTLAWPFRPDDFEDQKCSRCIALERYGAAKAVAA